jgi:hypothetical protein
METPDDWPFEDPPNVAVITTQAVLDGAWISLATLDEEDGDWQFHTQGTPDEANARLVALRRIYELDPSIAELADLPPGGRAWRDSADAPWQRA